MAAVDNHRLGVIPGELPGDFGKQQADDQQHQEADDEGMGIALALDPWANPAQDDGAEERQPQHIHRHLGQFGEECTGDVGCQRQYDGDAQQRAGQQSRLTSRMTRTVPAAQKSGR